MPNCSQAADTDILALVEIEKNTRHRFEFFMGRVSEEPISARTAWAYLNSGGSISHGLSVYECKLRMPNQVHNLACSNVTFLTDSSVLWYISCQQIIFSFILSQHFFLIPLVMSSM